VESVFVRLVDEGAEEKIADTATVVVAVHVDAVLDTGGVGGLRPVLGERRPADDGATVDGNNARQRAGSFAKPISLLLDGAWDKIKRDY
jgi:hypothetical protein